MNIILDFDESSWSGEDEFLDLDLDDIDEGDEFGFDDSDFDEFDRYNLDGEKEF